VIVTGPNGAAHGIAVSMDGRGQWRDNVFVERLWKSVKYEEVYLKAYGRVAAAREHIGRYLGRVPPSGVSPQVSKVEASGAQLITADSLAG
jgi:putative transposase